MAQNVDSTVSTNSGKPQLEGFVAEITTEMEAQLKKGKIYPFILDF